MDNSEENFALSYLQEWANNHEEFFAGRGVTNKYEAQRDGCGNLRFEFTNYLIDVCAWNHAHCLDIQIIHVPSRKESFPTTGACKTREDFKNRLDELYAFIENNSEQNQSQ